MFPNRALVLLLMSPLLLLPATTEAASLPEGFVIIEAGFKATLVWSPSGAPTAHDVIGVLGGAQELLGTAPPGANSFVAPSGYDSYIVRPVGVGNVDRTPCVRVIAAVPPEVRVIPSCSSGSLTHGFASLP